MKTLPEQRQWFLEAAITTDIPFFGLLDMESLYRDNYLMPDEEHGLPETEMVSVLTNLWTEGYIEVIDYAWSDELQEHVIQTLPSDSITPAMVETFLHVKAAEGESIWVKSSYYRLTAKGGAYWESLSQPDWNNYVKRGTVFKEWFDGEEEAGSIRSGSETYCRSIEALSQSVASEAMHLYIDVYIGQEEWSVVTPWEATYWKTFPQAHKVVYRRRDSTSLMHDIEAHAACYKEEKRKKESERWKILNQGHWYQSPWR
jgi:hypothetical protein